MASTTLREARARSRAGQAASLLGRNASVAFLLVAVVMLACFITMRLAGGAAHLSASWFCLPILIAGAYLGYAGGLGAGLASSLLAGPLMPLDADTAMSQHPSLWIARAGLFAIVGLLSAAASAQVRASYRKEIELAEEARDLAMRKAAVIETVSKEFRSPLTVLRGATHALERDGMVSEEAKPMLLGLESGTQRLVDLVAAVSAVLETEDRGGGLRWDTFSVKALLTRVVDHLGVRDPQGRVQVEIEPAARTCEADPELLYQLLRHLVENAVKFSDERVDVRVGRPSTARFTFESADRGPGIDEQAVRLAADPFSTGALEDRSRQGLGLGLFAAKRLTDVLGGTLAFADRPGGGTLAQVSIPATSPEPLPL